MTSGTQARGFGDFPATQSCAHLSFPALPPPPPSPRSKLPGITRVCSKLCAKTRYTADCDPLRPRSDSSCFGVPKSQQAFFSLQVGNEHLGSHGSVRRWEALRGRALGLQQYLNRPPGDSKAQTCTQAATWTVRYNSSAACLQGPSTPPPPCTLVQTPVVASQRVRMDTFCARFSQFTATLVLVAHFTMVM